MKRLSKIIKNNYVNENGNPGNSTLTNTTGVTNHYTPVQNILTNVKNLFCMPLGIFAEIAEDGVSIKLTSTEFVSKKKIDELLNRPMYNDPSTYSNTLNGYIQSQGLDKCTYVNLGNFFTVYFSPSDIASATAPVTINLSINTNESLISEYEMSSPINEDNEEEMKSPTVEKFMELLEGADKVKAAKQLEALVSKEISLPREYYFAAVKFKTGEECIALRWKYTKKMPFGKEDGEDKYKEITLENTRSLIHIFGKGEMAIWVQDYAKDSLVELPKEVKKLIDSILDLLEASETDDPSVYSLTGERKERKDDEEEKKDDKKEGEEKKEDESSDKKGDDEDDDSEDDDSRGGNDDDLLK